MTDGGRPLVYFSYRLRGSRAHAERLAEKLRHQGSVSVFADADIPPGSHWPSALQDGLDRADAIIVFVDRDWLHYQDEWGRRRIDNPEDWVHREVSHALTRVKTVLPVLVEDAKMPPKQALPGPLIPFAEVQAARLRLDHFETDAEKILAWAAELSGDTRGATRSASFAPPKFSSDIRFRKLLLSGFRCFEQIEIDFDKGSTLDGDWTCIVGLNGSGKTSILQAISLLVMGPDLARELGGERLQAMRRQDPSGELQESVLRGWIQYGGEEHYLEMTLTARGPKGSSDKVSRSNRPGSASPWSSLAKLPVAGFGASRNLSDSPDRWDGATEAVLSQISLFDPMARLIRAEDLLQPNPQSPARRLFRDLIEKVFADEAVRVLDDGKTIRFATGRSIVRGHDLPDGFRSSAAWMASICELLSAAKPSARTLEQLSGMVLIDEIDLHLHASLQRKIVPRLREALPGAQFIVTSHSALVISSFDRNELVLLDRLAEGGQRSIDRQIFAFTSDEVYNWLMDTPPHSAALDKKLEDPTDPDLPVLLYQTPDYDERQARDRHSRQRAILQEMGFEDGDEV